MRFSAALTTVLLLGQAALGAQFVETVFPTPDHVIAQAILEPGDARDDAERIQEAVDTVAASGGGVVFLRAGVYRLRTPVTVKPGVTLRGDWAPPPLDVIAGPRNLGGPLERAPDVDGAFRAGTRLHVYTGRNDEDGLPAIMLHRNAALRDLTVYYPEQNPGAPVPYSWTVASDPGWYEDSNTTNSNVEMCQSVIRATLVNPWKGIRIGPEANGQFMVDQIYMSPLRTGVQWDMVIDIGRIYGATMSPAVWQCFGDGSAALELGVYQALQRWMKTHADGIDCGRHDWAYVYDVQIYGMRAGLNLRRGVKDGVPTNAVLFGCRFIDCTVAIDSKAVSRFGLLATGCAFAGNAACIRKDADEFGVIQLNSCALGAQDGPLVIMEPGPDEDETEPRWKHRSGYVSLQNCDIRRWQGDLVALGHGTVALSNCTTPPNGIGPVFRAGPKANGLHLVANRFGGEPVVETDNAGDRFDLVVDAETRQFDLPDTSLIDFPAEAGPERRSLYDAARNGVSVDARDNTAPLQALLDRAGEEGGGTVYLPAGLYHVRGTLRVPTGVELRGCFEAPHQPLTPGTCLLAYAGREDPEGMPFLSLEARSGLRGITVHYPKQVWHDVAPRPYSWTVRALGDEVWLTYVTLANSWQGVDLWTHGSSGHYIKYLAGAFFRKGVWVSKTRGRGYIRDVQSNAHNTIWTDNRLNQRADIDWDLLSLKHQQMSHLEFLVLGSCDDEQTLGTFTYCGGWGISLREDRDDPARERHFGPNGRFINHGTDLSRHNFHVAAHGGKPLQFINNEMTPRAYDEVAGIVVEESFDGTVAFINNAAWAQGRAVADLRGPGEVAIQQMNNFTGVFRVDCATARIDTGYHQQYLKPQIVFGPNAGRVRVTGQTLAFYNQPRTWSSKGRPDRLTGTGNSKAD